MVVPNACILWSSCFGVLLEFTWITCLFYNERMMTCHHVRPIVLVYHNKLQHKWKMCAEFSLFLRTSEEVKFLFCTENLFSVEEYKTVNKTQNAFTFTALHVICEIRLWENFFLLAQTILLCWQFLDIFEKQHFLTVNLATGQPTCLYL